MLIKETYLICDGGCGATFGTDDKSHGFAEQRLRARAAGWSRGDGKDWCPECRAKKNAAAHEQRCKKRGPRNKD